MHSAVASPRACVRAYGRAFADALPPFVLAPIGRRHCDFRGGMAVFGEAGGLLYPMNRGLSLISSAVMASLFLRERVTLRSAFALLLAFFALLCINFF